MAEPNLYVGSPRAEFMPPDWHDEIVIHTMARNKDGSISVIALVNLYDGDGNRWTAERTIRLERAG
jgi:hypothetical protein